MDFPFVSIIFPNYNGKKDTLECLNSLLKLNYPKEKLEIIVVDNGSNDGSQKAILDFFKKLTALRLSLRLIQNQKNLGAPAAYNQGICAVHKNYEYIWKLDNDVIVDKNSLKKMVEFLEVDKKTGLASGKIYYHEIGNSPQGDYFLMKYKMLSPVDFSLWSKSTHSATVTKSTFWAIGGKINYFFGNFRNVAKNQKDVGQYETPRSNFDFLPGCATLIKKEVIKKIGLFDEKYFVYYDETDFCVRAKRAGYDLMYIPSAKIWHKASRTTREGSYFKNYYLTRNKFLFFRKFRKSIFIPVIYTLTFAILHRWLFRSKFTDLPNIVKGAMKGIKDGIKN
ncbi:MAG: glycosyltransferase family 2 protein [Patescibacteria group bacterium]